MAAGRLRMEAVELVEEDAPGGPAPAVPVRRRPGGRVRPGLRRVRTVLALAAVLGLAAGAEAVQDRREDARRQALVGAPGVVASLDEPVVELWRRRGVSGSDLRDVAGRLVGAVTTPYRTVDVVALDPRSGADAWRTPVAPAIGGDQWTRCVVPGAPHPAVPAGARPLVLCVAVDATTATEVTGLGSLAYASSARLVTVDALDGTLVRDVPTPPSSQVAEWGSHAAVAHVRGDGRARLVRLDPRTGVEQWSFTTPDVVPTDRFGQRRVDVRTAGDVAVLDAGTTWLVGADGRVRRMGRGAAPAGLGAPVELLAEGRLVARPVAVREGGWGTEVLDLETGTAWSADGSAVRARPDDGSLPDVVLLRSDASSEVVAHDRRTGAPRWRLELPPIVPVAVLGGRVVAVDGDVVRAVDGRTGAELWTLRLERPVRGGMVSDGRVLAVSASVEGGGGMVTAVGLDDGRRRWSTRTAHAPFLVAVDGRLFGWSARGLQAFGAPAP